MTDKEKIKAEIERLKEKILNGWKSPEGFVSSVSRGELQALNYILSFIDSLEEPVSEDLEEAVNAYIGHAPEVDECSSVSCERMAFKAGAQWQKKQEVKEVDLEKEIRSVADQYDINNNGNIYWEDIAGFAKHFFELGLKTQKGE